MSLSYFPKTDTERDEAKQSVTAYLGSTSADATFTGLDAALFALARETYGAARERYDAARSAYRTARGRAKTADADFDRDLRLFTSSIRDEAGRSAPRVVSDLLGGVSMSEVVSRTYREEVHRSSTLLRRLGERAGLTYDSARADTLKISTAALAVAADADDAAARELRIAGAALTAAKQSFDSAYRALLRAAGAILDEATLNAIFPRFVRANAKDEVVTTAEPTPEATGTDAVG